jgi:D-3-phosphoglycerate dehydrogenase
VICRERDIRVSETLRPEPGDYQMLMRITVAAEDGQRIIAGTVFGDKPRLVAVDGMPLEAELGRHVLFVRNLDKPGFIGALGNALAAKAINIASFHLGRTGAGEDAICLVEVDEELPSELLTTVQGLPNVIQVKSMNF